MKTSPLIKCLRPPLFTGYISCPLSLSVLNTQIWFSCSFAAYSNSYSDSFSASYSKRMSQVNNGFLPDSPTLFQHFAYHWILLHSNSTTWKWKKLFCFLSFTTALEWWQPFPWYVFFVLCICMLEAVFCIEDNKEKQECNTSLQHKFQTWILSRERDHSHWVFRNTTSVRTKSLTIVC